MNATAIEYIWQAIQESERSDELPFMDALTRLSQPHPDRPGAIRASMTAAVAKSLQANSNSLPTVTSPVLSRP